MPFPLIPTALGITFFLIWLFIGAMILRDGQVAAQREREIDGSIWAASGRPNGRKAA